MSQANGSSPSPAQWWWQRNIWVVRGVGPTAGPLDKDCFSGRVHRAKRNTEGSWLTAALPSVPPSVTKLLGAGKRGVIQDLSPAHVLQVSIFQEPLQSEAIQTVPVNSSVVSPCCSIHKAGP